jgi:hypothetical protein
MSVKKRLQGNLFPFGQLIRGQRFEKVALDYQFALQRAWLPFSLGLPEHHEPGAGRERRKMITSSPLEAF